jgi:nucleotide-binding universal stress UspA family protein
MEFNNILAYVDERAESENTLMHAAALTKASKAAVSVIDVLEALGDVESWPSSEELESLRGVLVQSRSEWLRLQANKHGLSSADISVRIGKTSVEIIRQVLRQRHDLVLKTARGRIDGRRISFGATATHLIRKCPCPVWLVAPGTKPPPRRILAAINPIGADRATMARKLLTQAASLAERFDAELQVLHSWNPHVESLLQSKVASDVVTRHIESSHSAARNSLAQILEEAELSVLDRTVHLVLGNAVDAIASVALDQRIDVIVMGSVGRSYRDGQLIGSVAEELITRVDCSIFCIKPDGFVSPIRID